MGDGSNGLIFYYLFLDQTFHISLKMYFIKLWLVFSKCLYFYLAKTPQLSFTFVASANFSATDKTGPVGLSLKLNLLTTWLVPGIQSIH